MRKYGECYISAAMIWFNINTQSTTNSPIDWVVECDGLVVVAMVVVLVVCVVVVIAVDAVVVVAVGAVVIVWVVDVGGGLAVVGLLLVVCVVCGVDTTN